MLFNCQSHAKVTRHANTTMVGYITFFSCTFSKQERSIFLTDFHPNNTSFRHFANPKSGKNPPGLFSSKKRPTAVKGLEKQLVHALNRYREKTREKRREKKKALEEGSKCIQFIVSSKFSAKRWNQSAVLQLRPEG